MPKITLFLFALLSFNCAIAQQSDLKFDKDYYRCENKWVSLPLKQGDSIQTFGFVYLDRTAGFTINVGGTYSIKNNIFIAKPHEKTTNMIYRFSPGYSLLAILPDYRLKQMKLPAQPDWLHIYREGENETSQLLRRGFIYNDIGASDLALDPLLKAYAKEPHFKELEFELSFAYNALEKPERAVEVLQKAIKNDSKNYMFYRELGYSFVHLNKQDEAEKIYKKGIAMSDNDFQKSEMAFNMAGSYYRSGNRKKFDEWAAVVKKYASKDSIYLNNLTAIEADFNKK